MTRSAPRRLLALGLLLGALPAAARDVPAEGDAANVRNVRVWFGAVTGAGDDRLLALQVEGGGRVLFTSAPRPADRATWRHSVRVYTTRSQPLVFRVLATGAAETPDPPALGGARTRRRGGSKPLPIREIRAQDAVLAEGFEDLVGDYELPEARQLLGEEDTPPRRGRDDAVPAPAAAADGRRVLCRATLAWPPADGTHALRCGDMTLEVRTRRLPDDAR
jgi:hypothetical protein